MLPQVELLDLHLPSHDLRELRQGAELEIPPIHFRASVHPRLIDYDIAEDRCGPVCRDAPLAGETFTLKEDVWTSSREDHWTSEGDQCIYVQLYHVNWVDGDTLYDLVYQDSRPVDGEPNVTFGCLDYTLPTFECQTVSVTRYERPESP